MKRNKLATPIALGLALAAASAPDAQAMHMDRNGAGQVLIYPYYTVNSGNQTVLSVVNQTGAGKAIKVRFREGHNSREVLDFNLYLSPFDVWTATVFSQSDTGPNNPANLVTTDTSCTVPRIRGNTNLPMLANGNRYVPFMNYRYTGSGDDAGPNTLDRLREGYFELIEMGEVNDFGSGSLPAITHGSNGIPSNCLKIERAWLPPGSGPDSVIYWTANPLADMSPPRGGLFGSASIINALDGTLLTYDAEAIDDFSDITQHTSPAVLDPTLASGHDAGASGAVTANVFRDGSMVSSRYPAARAIDAVSALFAQEDLFNEFSTSAATGAQSEWIVTFPTKYAYVDQAIVGNTALAPFREIFPTVANVGNAGIAQVRVAFLGFDREESDFPRCQDPDDITCYPFGPPPGGIPTPSLFWASNVIAFNQPQAQTAGSNILGSRLVVHADPSDYNLFDGWMGISLHPPSSGAGLQPYRLRADLDGGVWRGVPALGFWAMTFTNGQITPGVLSNYSEMSRLRHSNAYEPGVIEAPIFKDQFE